MKKLQVWLGALLGWTLLFPGAWAQEAPSAVSYRVDVQAVLAKGGCNRGTCHGNKNGKGGFRLSLRGEDPAWDHQALVRDQLARRIDLLQPRRSLLLRKATMQVAHQGGKRFAVDSRLYRILLRWIEQGARDDAQEAPRVIQLQVRPRDVVVQAPREEVQLRVTARFSDGTQRDVTWLAVYETTDQRIEVTPQGLVRRRSEGQSTVLVRFLDRQVAVRVAFVPHRPHWRWQAPPPRNYIDRLVFTRLKQLRVHPAPLCNDVEFVRRAYLDLLGRVPSAQEARRFAQDARPDKRDRLIDQLLQHPEFVDYWAQKWCDVLRVEEKQLDRKGVSAIYNWLRQCLRQGMPLDRMCRELIAARGSTYRVPAANWYRANRTVEERAENTARVFLGVRLQCAKCHNHPFDRWTQDDYYGWAALFGRVQYKILENRRRDRNDKHEFDGEQIVYLAPEGEVNNPRTGRPARPRFLSDEPLGPAPGEDPLVALAEWVTSPENRRFAATQVNRIWFHLLGRGLVDPVDDFRDTNPAVHPRLLEALCDDLVASGFDLRHLIRRIMRSQVYQLSWQADPTNRNYAELFACVPVRRLGAEQLAASLAQVLQTPLRFNGYPLGTRATEVAGVRAVRLRDRRPGSGDRLLALFGKPPRLIPCECERRSEATLKQAFELLSGPVLHQLLTRSDNVLGRMLQQGKSDEEILDYLYYSALSRPPRGEERAQLLAFLKQRSADRRRAWEDVAWALLNSPEFLFRR